MKYFITSIPKSGTHLMANLLELSTEQPVISVKEKATIDTFDFSKYSECTNLVGHWRIEHINRSLSLRRLFFKRSIIVLVRDPRDLCNSMLHYVMISRNPRLQFVASQLASLNYEQQIMLLAAGIKGVDGNPIIPELHDWCFGFLELQNEFEQVEILRYEDFFRNDVVSNFIAKTQQISVDDARLQVKSAMSSKSKTKREGGARPEQWKALFSLKLKKHFADNYADTIRYLGYEA